MNRIHNIGSEIFSDGICWSTVRQCCHAVACDSDRIDEGDHLGVVEQYYPSVDFVARDFSSVRPTEDCPGTDAQPARNRLGLAEPASTHPIKFRVLFDK